MDKVYGVVFSDGGKTYYFKSTFDCAISSSVIVETEKGEQYGKVVNEITEKKLLDKIDTLKNIIRLGTKDDLETHLQNLKDGDRALKRCREIKDELKLEMKVISANFTFDKKQLLFNFLADERIDFRELARKLASIYRTRIELRQVGARDKAKEIGGLGICGQKLCCSNFLNQIETVSINMAKNQNLALNPTKINGACNRLLCCLAYEDDNYSASRKGMPYLGEEIITKHGSGKVINVDILNRKCSVLIDGEKVEIEIKDDNNKE